MVMTAYVVVVEQTHPSGCLCLKTKLCVTSAQLNMAKMNVTDSASTMGIIVKSITPSIWHGYTHSLNLASSHAGNGIPYVRKCSESYCNWVSVCVSVNQHLTSRASQRATKLKCLCVFL